MKKKGAESVPRSAKKKLRRIKAKSLNNSKLLPRSLKFLRSWMAKSYLCQCGVLWYKCKEHSKEKADEGKTPDAKPSEESLPSGKPPQKVGKPKKKRPEEEDLEGNFKVPKRK